MTPTVLGVRTFESDQPVAVLPANLGLKSGYSTFRSIGAAVTTNVFHHGEPGYLRISSELAVSMGLKDLDFVEVSAGEHVINLTRLVGKEVKDFLDAGVDGPQGSGIPNE